MAQGIVRVAGSRTNLYVITEGDSLCLVDTGYPDDLPGIVEALGTLGRSLADVSAVLLTHAHPDHIGSAERVRTEHGATVYTHVEEAANARGERIEQMSIAYVIGHLWQPKMISFAVHFVRHGGTKVLRLGEVATFTAKQTALDLPGGPVPVLTPGHTSGHCAFHLPDRGVLITGDALVTHDSLTQGTGPRLLHAAFNHDQRETVRSLDLLRGLEADVLLPGHGEPFRGSPDDAVDQAIAHLH